MQLFAGMDELNERVQNAEARATEAERQAQATQQELARSHAGVKGYGKGAAVPFEREQGIGARLHRSTSLAFERRGRQVERLGSSFC